MRPILLFIFMICAITSCTLISGHTPEKFKYVDAKIITPNTKIGAVKEGYNNRVLVNKFDFNSELYLPNILDTVYGIKLDNRAESLVGSIQKIRLVDNSIFLLDKYVTKSVKKFSMDGNYIATIGQRGNGPGEYYEPTDFFVSDSLVVIYDQFKSFLLYYDLSGNFIRNKQLPFFALSFHIFDNNTYLFHTFDSDNYHLPEILNYSLVWTDSTFAVKYVNAYREKDKYSNLVSMNNIDLFNGELYYHEPFSDTIFRVSPYGDIYYDFVFSFPKNELPPELILQKNSQKYVRATGIESTNNYVCNIFNPIIAKDFLYIPVSLNSRVYDIINSSNTNNVITNSGVYSSNQIILFSPPFSNILNCQDNTLIGYVNAYNLYGVFEKVKKYNELHLLSDELIEYAKDVKETDNVIIVFSKLKDF